MSGRVKVLESMMLTGCQAFERFLFKLEMNKMREERNCTFNKPYKALTLT